MLGDNIRYLRIKRGYSQEYIAEQLGYKSYTTIQKWESGVSEPPVKKLKELSVLLNADMDDMANTDLKSKEESLPNHSTTDNILVLSDNEKELVLNYRRLNSEDKKMVERMISYSAKIQSTDLTKNSN